VSASLFAWCADTLQKLRTFPDLRVRKGQHELTFRFGDLHFDGGAGCVALEGWCFALETSVGQEVTSSVYLGSIREADRELPSPVGKDADAAHVLERFHALCGRWAAWSAQRDAIELVMESIAPRLLPLELLHAVAVHGPPPPIPVPPLDIEAVERAARRVVVLPTRKRDPIEREDRKLIAAYEIDRHRILLTANLVAHPHGVEIFVRDASGATIEALSVDPANPQARWSPDGDALALRRFVTWLRELVLRSDSDRLLTFVDQIADEKSRVLLSELLLFDEPYFGDEFLVDWRYQLDLLVPRSSHTNIVPADVAVWRAFLGSVVDPALSHS
jgi:hypothetical protein